MFTPTIDLQVLSNAKILRITDTTGPDIGTGTKWDGTSGIDSTDVSSATLDILDPNNIPISVVVTSTILGDDPITGDIVFPDQIGQWIDGHYYITYNILMVVTAITKFEEDLDSGIPSGNTKITSPTHLLVTGMKTVIAGTTNYNGTYIVTVVDADTFYIKKTFISDDATGTSTPFYTNTFVLFAYANAENAITRMYQIFSAMEESNEADDYLKQCNTAYGLLQTLKNILGGYNTIAIENIYGRIIRILDYNSIELQY